MVFLQNCNSGFSGKTLSYLAERKNYVTVKTMSFMRYWSSHWWNEKLKPNAQRIAAHPRAEGIVFLLEFAGITIFPIPVALLLVALVPAAPRKWLRFALSATGGSLLGSFMLYLIGNLFFQSVGERLISFYGAQEAWMNITDKFDSHLGITFILLAGLTTGLMRIASLGAGFTAMNPLLFILLLAISRSVRFIAECASIKFVGERVQSCPTSYYKYAAIGAGAVLLLTLAVLTLIK
jgi:membrane protein YqaA with SNARE-associated domain